MTQDSIDRRPIGSPQADWKRAEDLLAHDGNGYQRHLRLSRTETIDPTPKVFVP